MHYTDFKSEMWSIMYLLKTSMNKVIEPIVAAEGLTMIQTYILFGISCDKITNIGSLSKELGLNQGNVSTMCKAMEKCGLLIRSRNPNDERIVTLTLTEKSEKILERLQLKSYEFDELLKKIPKEKLETIINGMNEFNNLLKLLSNDTN